MNALTDNDVLYKGACFRVLDALVGEDRPQVGVLGAAKFVLPKKIRKTKLRGSADDAIAALEAFISEAEEIETTEDEQLLAAELELLAQHESLPFDTGESQLCAVLILRGVPQLQTGDKRAIEALERLLDREHRLESVQGRVRCLEQLVRLMIERTDLETTRTAVCGEPDVDRALSACFSCSSDSYARESIFEGLSSYIADLRRKAGRILAAHP